MDRDFGGNPDLNRNPGIGSNPGTGFGEQPGTGNMGGLADQHDEGVTDRAAEAVERGRERASEAADQGREKAAAGVDRLGDRLHERAREMENRGGIQQKVAGPMHRAGDAADSAAEYVRTHDLGEVRDDLQQQIRAHPLVSVGIALGAGYLLGRMLD
jgi:ElaB/YqjD/DUF883 family membrane-anchored ribosome-binding protein